MRLTYASSLRRVQSAGIKCATQANSGERCKKKLCRAFDLDATYQWEDLESPCLEEGGRYFVSHERIRSHEVGPNQQSDIIAISNMLQEAASNHIVTLRGRSEQYFAADPELAMQDLIFVLTNMQIRMQQYPRWGDIVRVKTFFNIEGRFRARRDWILTNAMTGEQIGRATSGWVMFNYKTRRLGRMPDDFRESYEKLSPQPPIHTIDASETRLKLPEVPSTSPIIHHTASPNYMDMNNHLNNTAYLTWILDSLPDTVLSDRVLAQYEVEYKAEGVGVEAIVGDQITVRSSEVEDISACDYLDGALKPRQFITVVEKIGGEKPEELIRARTTWVQV